MAEAIAEGIEGVDGCRAGLRRVPDIAESKVIFGGQDMTEAGAPFAHVEIVEIGDLINYDGIAFGTPVYFGGQSSALRFFMDQAGTFWMEGSLAGKPATAFAGAGSGAGREAALLSLWSTFAVFGMTLSLPVQRRVRVIVKD